MNAQDNLYKAEADKAISKAAAQVSVEAARDAAVETNEAAKATIADKYANIKDSSFASSTC